MNDPERTLVEAPPGAPEAPASPRAARGSFLGAPERLALLIYGACLVLVLVLYHFQ